jgi:hypothetical protein
MYGNILPPKLVGFKVEKLMKANVTTDSFQV